MIKKILFVFIAVFAFNEINAQANIITHTVACGNVSEDVYYEWEYETDNDISGSDDRMQFRRLNSPSGDVITYPTGWVETVGGTPVLASGGTNVRISWDSANTRWVYRNGATIIFEAVGDTPSPPSGGWNTVISCPSGISTNNFSADASADGTVLPVDKDELANNKINIFPNPSSDFISVSNINEATAFRITNIAGQTVINTMIDANNNDVDVRELAKGFYFVEIAGKKTIKFIKK